jgi:hypothetical protein
MLNHYIPEGCSIEAFGKFLMELQCIQCSSWLVPHTAGCCHQCWASFLGGLYGDSTCTVYRFNVLWFNMSICFGYLHKYLSILTLIPLPLKFTDSPWAVSHMCPHFSDSSTTWPPSEHIFHHTDFLRSDLMFFFAVSFTDMLEPF